MIRASGSVGLTGSSPFKLQASHAAEIAALPGVRSATPIGQALDKSDWRIWPTTHRRHRLRSIRQPCRYYHSPGRKRGSGDEAIIDPQWKENRHAKVGDTVKLFERPFTIVGVYQPPGGSRIKIHLRLCRTRKVAEGRATAILVACTNPAQQDAIGALINNVSLTINLSLLATFPSFMPAVSRPLTFS